MRLINTTTLELREFIDDDRALPYAILSHTWEEEEVSFQHMERRDTDPSVKVMKGYDKISQCCRLAREVGLDWAWVDTCCIDKKSSAELSEAINSMYRWYQNATICYAYLSDLKPEDYEAGQLGACRWFTRGWTLQELIAPKELIFFTADWQRLSTKAELQEELEAITSVPKSYLLRQTAVTEASIAMRMSWAAKRATSRTEDIAYCLLGLFDISMPLLYGEGKKAFRRLQEEIIKIQPYEHTIYAWGDAFSLWDEEPLPSELQMVGDLHVDQTKFPYQAEKQWNEDMAKPLLGLLADSPANFENCGRFAPSAEKEDMVQHFNTLEPPRHMHGGIRQGFTAVQSPSSNAHPLTWPPIFQARTVWHARLFVSDTSMARDNRLVLPLIKWGAAERGRTGRALIWLRRDWFHSGIRVNLFVKPEPTLDAGWQKWRNGEIIFRWPLSEYGHDVVSQNYDMNAPTWTIRWGEHAFVRGTPAETIKDLDNGWVATWEFKRYTENKVWALAMHRVPDDRKALGSLAISLCRVLKSNKSDDEDDGDDDGIIWHPWEDFTDKTFEEVKSKSCASYVMREKVEIWQPDCSGLPSNFGMCVESMRHEQRNVEVDVVDFRFPEGSGDELEMIPKIDRVPSKASIEAETEETCKSLDRPGNETDVIPDVITDVNRDSSSAISDAGTAKPSLGLPIMQRATTFS